MELAADSRAEAALGLQVQALVARLQNLREGPQVLPQIVMYGETAVPALEAFLRGPSSALHHQRALAADALALIGTDSAFAALSRAIRDSVRRQLDPQFLQAEDVVVSRIAEYLGHRPSAEAAGALLEALRTRAYPACVRALGALGEACAIPLIAQCLFEDSARGAAMEVLGGFGVTSLPWLRAALAAPAGEATEEPLLHVAGRAAAAELLGQLEDRESLRRALEDTRPLVRHVAALGLVRLEASRAPRQVIDMLTADLGEPDWARARLTMDALIGAGAAATTAAILRVLRNADSEERARRRRRRAAMLAGDLGLACAAAPLAALCDDEDAHLRLSALDALARLPAASPWQIGRFLCDPERIVAQRALQALLRRTDLPATPRRIYTWMGGSRARSRWRRAWRALQLSMTMPSVKASACAGQP